MNARAAITLRQRGRAEVLRELLAGRKRLLVLTHTNPDPDSLGAAVGLREFAWKAARLEGTLALHGRILRAENQEMVRQLGIHLEPLADIELAKFDCVAMVDTQPGFGHTVVPDGLQVDIVIDHHVCSLQNAIPYEAPFIDVRREIGATSSLIASYFMGSNLTPSTETATALVYGINTDTADLSRNVCELDLAASDFLMPLVDRAKLVAITKPRLPPAYYRTLREALSKVRLYGHLALCSLGKTVSPEMVAEVADLLLRMEGIQAVFCGGLVEDVFYVSVRTEIGPRDAWTLIRDAVGNEDASYGGHGTVAGGSIPLGSSDSRALKRLERRLERNILRSMGMEGVNAVGLGDFDE
ncbi:MAG: DHHA1 domain-containing protein [Planctomycetota bacterium]